MSGAPSRCSPIAPNSLPDRRSGAVRFQRVRVGPLLDEHERAVGLVQRVELAARLLVYLLDGCVHASRTVSTDSGLAVMVATTTTGMRMDSSVSICV